MAAPEPEGRNAAIAESCEGHDRSPQLSLKLTRVALSVATTVVVVLAFVLTATGSASTKPTHFAGFPPEGVKASTPTTGRLLIGLSTWGPRAMTTWNVYADGRVIWQKWTSSGDATVVPDGARRLDTGYVQQRLTLQPPPAWARCR